jgi:RNA polymerase sigma-70 factor (ECF subfamily)
VSVNSNKVGQVPSIPIEVPSFAVPTRRDIADQIDRFYQDNYAPLYRYLVLTGSTSGDAHDVIQEAFFRLLRFLRAGSGIDKPRNWLLRVCHNIRLDEKRRGNRWPLATEEEVLRYTETEPDPQPNPESAALQGERLARMRTALAQLSRRQCEYLLLRAEGVKLREIAEMYEVTPQAVADACGRAMERLGKLIHD